MKRIYLARHGDIGLGRDKRYIGIQDLPLSGEGRKQALALAALFTQVALDRVYCSSLTRSQETAAVIAEGHALPLTILPDLHEIHMGEWEGKLFKEIRERFPSAYQQRGEDLVNYRPPGGERFLDCYHRVIPVFEEIGGSEGQASLIVGHAGINRVILCHAIGLSLQDVFAFEQGYGCLYLLKKNTSGHWNVEYVTATDLN